jgi:very-short-patch-repair endonuclease
MEWKFAGIEERFKIKLIPQKQVNTDSGTYYLDFLIIPQDKRITEFKIAIELDGHDFHEKTKQQVARDRKRERKIISKGYTMLRFTGSEVYNNPRACINEVADYLENIIFSQK